ncbi:MAG: M23 family metallopeptidase [Thermodesulfobacteriota bacterium]
MALTGSRTWWSGRRRPGSRLAIVLTVAVLLPGCGLIGGDRRGDGDLGGDGGRTFVWPASGTISSSFGPRRNAHHDGIDIAAPEGTPIRAALDGVVVYVGSLRGYGKVVILSHEGGLTTVYAHNSKNLVKQGARVRRGGVIASVGRTGRTTGPNLHFEVRKDNRARDPLAYLPRKAPSQLAQRTKRDTGG